MRTVSFDLLFIARKKDGGHHIRLEDVSEKTFQTHYVLPPDCTSRQFSVILDNVVYIRKLLPFQHTAFHALHDNC